MGVDLNNSASSNYDSKTSFSIATKNLDGLQAQKETRWRNSKWSEQYGIFSSVADLQSAVLMKVIWILGKGYTTDTLNKVILDHISGTGKETALDILFNVEVQKEIGGDGFAEIVWNDNETEPLNLKALDPANVEIIYNSQGRITGYDYFVSGEKTNFKPNQIYHRSRHRLGNQIHGLSIIDPLKSTILADEESFTDVTKIMHRQAKPMIMFKLKTDNASDISAFISKMDSATEKGENIYIPNDTNTVEYEVVQVNVSEMILAWRTEVRNKFYRALGLPLIIFGNGGSTESGGKMEYLAHEQVFERDQKDLELQIWKQLKIKLDLIPPTSLLENLQTDTAKDGQAQQMSMQKSDLQAGRGA